MQQRHAFFVAASLLVAPRSARAMDDDAPAPPPSNVLPPSLAPPEPLPQTPERSETIEVSGRAPVAPGALQLDGATARTTPGALGDPLRALALLPGVITPIGASGYPIIRGALPGESRFEFDGIELPLLYHFAIGNQVIHPSLVGDLELRAGGAGAEHGNLIGGLVALTAATPDTARTELRADLVELGAYRFQPVSPATSIAAAVRVGTFSLMKAYRSDHDLYYVDQQTRLVHRLDNGDQLTLTSLGAFDYYARPEPVIERQTDRIGFHRLDARWTRSRAGGSLRAGVQTELDTLKSVTTYPIPAVAPGFEPEPAPPPLREGGSSYGVRAYADASAALLPGLDLRSGIEARHRTLVHGVSPFDLTAPEQPDPYFEPARRVETGGAWASLAARIGPVTVAPGVRGDLYQAELHGATARATTIDPRLAISAVLPGDRHIELDLGRYSAPPQLSVFKYSMVIGPLPMADGLGASAGMSHATEAQLSLRTPLGAGWQASASAYYHDVHRAIDFGLVDKTLPTISSLVGDDACRDLPFSVLGIESRAMGLDVMIRGQLGRSLTGWLSYSLAEVDREFGFLTLPGDYDQRHTLNATGQWRYGSWRFGSTLHVNSGRALSYPQHTATCGTAPDVRLGSIRRPPPTLRLDLRAEREYQFAGWRMTVFAELQDATFAHETIGYVMDFQTQSIQENQVFYPLGLIGLEAVL